MSRGRFVALAAAAMLVTGSFAAAQSDDVTITLPRPVAQLLLQELEEALGTTTTTGGTTTTTSDTTTTVGVTTTTVGVTTTTLPATTTTTSPPPTTTTTVTSPPGACVGVQIAAGANLVTVANGQPAGTTFCLAAGVYPITTAIPDQTGDQWVGTLDSQGVRQSVVTGNDVTLYAFAAVGNNVQLRNIVIEKFKSPVQRSPFQSNFYLGPPTGWVVDNVESRYNWATGMGIGSNGIVRNSYIHHNRQNGITTNGTINVVLEANEIAFNNYLGLYNPGGATGEAGGSKFLKTTNLIARGNYIHDNCGPGLWTDSNNQTTTYENNTFLNNAGPGIMHEISYSAVIKNNHLEGNAHGTLGPGGPSCLAGFSGFLGGMYISTSRDVEVFGNTLLNNDGGVIAQQENRGTGILGVWESDGLNVHDNVVTFQGGIANPWHGFRYVSGSATVNGMRFENNDYDMPNVSGSWWMFNGLKTWAAWQALGYDDTGSVG